MSKLDELIQQYCPDGVEYKSIESITKSICSGLNPRKNFTLNCKGAVCHYLTVKEMTTGKIIFSDKTDKITPDAVNIIQNRSRLEIDDILLSGIGTIGKVAIVDIPVDNWNCSESVLLLKPNKEIICPKYLKYILEGNKTQEYFNSHATGSTLKGIRQKDLRTHSVPVPPLPVQEEIVRILDNFTELQAELQAELQKRIQQYNYYRDNLLSFEGRSDVEWKKLGDVCLKVCSGGTPSRGNSDYFTGDIPWLRTQEVDWKDIYDTEIKITEDAVKNSSAKLIPENCVIIAMYGATAGKVAINKIPLTTNQACCNLQINPQKALYKYVYYWVCNEYERLKSLGQGSQNNINAQIIKEYPIPVPSLEEQQRTVAILDRFDALTTDITTGLPAEIEARRKQYEYYRDQLLTFKHKA